jgi:hypothetical protein
LRLLRAERARELPRNASCKKEVEQMRESCGRGRLYKWKVFLKKF